MPELPEVETVARQVAGMICGRTIRRLEIIDDKLALPWSPDLRGRRVVSVERIGKQVVIGTDPPLWIGVHLRMTGRLLWYPARRQPRQLRHLRARLHLSGGQLWFHDVRRFGTLRLHPARAALAPDGVEPLSAGFTARRLRALLGESEQALKVWLLRQDRLVGLGNIYACEILHAARLSPVRPARSLSDVEVACLHRATRRILRQAIECCGTTFSDFQDARGVYGGFQEFLMVYAREGERCRRCPGPILRIVQQQRSTFYCPECQQ